MWYAPPSPIGTGVGLLLLAAAAAILVVPWWNAWRRRGLIARRICPYCKYDVSQGRESICPECGKVPGDLPMPNRRLRLRVLIAIVLVCGGVNCWWARYRLRIEGATGWIPTTVLIFLTDLQSPFRGYQSGSRSDYFRLAIRSRDDYGMMWDWQVRLITRRETWAWSDADIDHLVCGRSRWPVGEQLTFDLGDTSGRMPLIGARSVLVQRRDDQKEMFGENVKNLSTGEVPPPWLICDPMPMGTHSMVFDITIEEPDGTSLHRSLTRQIQIVERGVPVMEAASSPKIAEIVQYALIMEAPRHPRDETGSEISFSLDPNLLASALAEWPGLMTSEELSFSIEVLDGERVVYRSYAGALDRWSKHLRSTWIDRVLGRYQVATPNDPNSMYLKDEVLDRLRVRVRGEELPLLANLRVNRFWHGEFTVPFRKLMKTQTR